MIDYFISAKRKGSNDRITHLKVHVNQNEKPSSDYSTLTKDQVVHSIESSKEIYTWSFNKVGAKVNVVKVNGNKYLRTDKNETPKDNLENLLNF